MTRSEVGGRRSEGKRFAAMAVAVIVCGCTVGPDFKQPETDLPQTLGVPQASVPAPQEWWTVFHDPLLDRMVAEALEANRDLRAAAQRIEQSRAQVAIARSAMWPDAGVA